MTVPEYATFAAAVEHRADLVVRMDEQGHDPEDAHHEQDRLAYDVLGWIAVHSTDERARDLAAQAKRTFDTDGQRWFA